MYSMIQQSLNLPEIELGVSYMYPISPFHSNFEACLCGSGH
uniref:Uncharacterized protein MANES_15G183800 n=1 Tax=Rhizophora mucronata TaxID=61149 RepID=A0A2P2JH26_RHIMU